jgi:enoyl-CoA hydratase/carnithine racemase
MTDDVRFERRGSLGLITLDRPQALNALNRAMCLAIHSQLDAWSADDAVAAVAIQGEGDRAFCAGGDVVTVYHAGKTGSDEWEGFFHDEYRMNHAIATYPKPYVALIDGIVMGGGVGLSIHAPYRVATERTLFAMPETGIGLIPDVGGTHALPRLPGELGTYLGLTGARLKAADCRYAGVATHYVTSDRIEALIDRLAAADDVAATLATFDSDPGDATLPSLRDAIDLHFAHDQVEDVLASLADGDEWARGVHSTLGKMSPTSCKLTLRALREGRGQDIAACLRTEYRIVCGIKAGQDFYEGIRAQLIDKDRNPSWSPATLADVTDEEVERHFRAPPSGDVSLPAV